MKWVGSSLDSGNKTLNAESDKNIDKRQAQKSKQWKTKNNRKNQNNETQKESENPNHEAEFFPCYEPGVAGLAGSTSSR